MSSSPMMTFMGVVGLSWLWASPAAPFLVGFCWKRPRVRKAESMELAIWICFLMSAFEVAYMTTKKANIKVMKSA